MMEEQINRTTGQMVFFLMFQKYMKDAFIVNYVNFIVNIFSKYQCGFRKGFSTQYALLVRIEKVKIARHIKEFCAAFLADLSKAFECMSQSSHCKTKRLWIRSKCIGVYL